MNALSSYNIAKQPLNHDKETANGNDGDRRRRSMAFSTILPLVYSRGSSPMKHEAASLPTKSSTFSRMPSFDTERPRRPPAIRSSSISTNSSTSAPIHHTFDPSYLQPGRHASLLSHEHTISLYQKNCKKTDHPDMICDFSLFLIEAGASLLENDPNRSQYLHRAEKLLKQLAARGHPAPQYHLGTLYASGLLDRKRGKQQLSKAFPYFLQAAKLHHREACFRIGKCYEDGIGCSKDSKKAGKYYAKSALLYHPGGMFRLGVAKLNGDFGMAIGQEEGIQWLERSMDVATTEYPHAVHELGLLYERGILELVTMDIGYALQLYIEAADQLGYAPSAYRLGECYEHGQLGCDVDLTLAIHYYTMAAQSGHAEACFALAGWYLVGVPLVLPVSEYEAYVWARRAAQGGCVKAEYAMGYFTQVGIGCTIDRDAANTWYNKAAQHGDPCAIHRLQNRGSPANSSLSSIKLIKAREGCFIM